MIKMKPDIVNTAIILKLRMNEDTKANYLKHYETFSGTMDQFLSLDKITYDDKIRVASRLMTKEQCAKAAIKIAESVLHIYEKRFPNDDRPRKALEYLDRDVCLHAGELYAILAVTRSVVDDVEVVHAKTSAQNWSAFVPVHVARYAADSVLYAAVIAYTISTASSARVSAYAANAAGRALAAAAGTRARKEKQEQLNLKIISDVYYNRKG
jgi:hypothetical protein